MKTIKELERKLKSSKMSEPARLEAHFHLAAGYLGKNYNKCYEHGNKFLQGKLEDHKFESHVKVINQILEKSPSKMSNSEIGQLNIALGNIFRRNQLDTAYHYYNKALEIFTELKLSTFMAESYCKLSYIHNKKGEYKKSEAFLKKSEKLAKDANNNRVLSICYTQFGEIHYYRGEYEKTLEYYLKSLQLDEESGEVKEISKSYNNIGTVYYKIRDFEKAKEYFAKALEMKLTLPDKSGLEFSYNNLGAVNFILKRYDKSLQLYQKSLTIRENLNDVKGQIGSCCNIGGVYFETEDIAAALKWFHRAYELCLQINDRHFAAMIMGNIANCQRELADFKQAVASAQIQLNLAEQLEEKPLQNSACKTLYVIYETLGDFQKALEFHKKHKQLSDSIYYNDSEKRISDIKAKYDLEKKKESRKSRD